jgi:hypothetical protein
MEFATDRDRLCGQPKVIQAIEVPLLRGDGASSDDTVRCVVRYYSLDGKFLGEKDLCFPPLPEDRTERARLEWQRALLALEEESPEGSKG